MFWCVVLLNIFTHCLYFDEPELALWARQNVVQLVKINSDTTQQNI